MSQSERILGERILVVEDDADMNALVRELLGRAGYRTDPAFDGEQAVVQVQCDPPDAVLLDVMLPGIDGFEVCRQLKFHRQTNGVPILMLTALGDQQSRRDGLRVGANRYLTKPFDPNVLFQELRAILDHRRALATGTSHTAVEFQMTSDNRRMQQLNDLLGELFVLTDLPDGEIDHVRQAVLEMIENAREWGNKARPDLLVTVTYEVTDTELKFVISDQGSGFDPTKLKHAARDDDPLSHMDVREKLGLRYGGFGMMLTRGIMDSVTYNERGNQVTLVKQLKKR
jgi:CheY-like chemotaxis protein/anti-sigma regulatory factor (Ser/Thr protein kinase)